MNLRPAIYSAIVGLCTLIASGTISQSAEPFSDDQQKALQKIIRDTILKDPTIIRDALVELEKQQADEQAKQQRQGIASNADALFRGKNALVAGNPNGDVTVVEFFDYNCGFCRKATADILKLVEKDNNVRVIFKELPIFGDQSEAAAKAAIASKKQGKYFEFHRDMMLTPGTADLNKAVRVAKKLGLDVDKLKVDMKDQSVDDQINRARLLANSLGIQGTPFYLVGDTVIPGAPDDLYDQFVLQVADIRKNGCKLAKC